MTVRFSKASDAMNEAGADVWDDHFVAVARQDAGEDVIVMSVGDPHADTPRPIVAAAIAALEAGDTHYTGTDGRLRIREAVAAKLRALTDVPYDAGQIVVTLGCQNALYAAVTVLLDPGDEVLALEPMFTTYQGTVEAAGATLVTVACPASQGYQPDIEELERRITPRTRAILFASPANPTGVVISPDRLEAIARLARNHDLWVISDEVYCDLIYDETHRSIASLPDMAARTIICGSLSKSHAMTGWRIGWAAGPRDFARRHATLNLAMTYGLPGFVQEAGAFALERGDRDSAPIKAQYREGRDRALAVLDRCAAIDAWRPQAGLFIMVDVSRTGLGGSEFTHRLFHEHGVSLLPGSVFGASAAASVRLCFAIAPDMLVAGCERIVAFAERLVEERELTLTAQHGR